MSNPNQANINTYLLGTYSTNLTATLSTIIQNAANSNGVLKVNSILFNNYSATLNSNITLRLNKFNAGNVNLHNKLAVPANSRNYFLNRNAFLVLNEGDSLSANTDANNANVAITIGYEEMGEKTKNNYIAEAYPIEYLIVGGGGGGGLCHAGGGGGGGFLTGSLPLSITSSGNVAIIVGGGGTGGSGSGSNSCIGSIKATGGGRGGGVSLGPLAGGSGGGAGGESGTGTSGGLGNLGGFTPAEGNNGGSGGAFPSYNGGGGGGASQAGSPGPSGGGGGAGGCSGITGVILAYAGGGGGGVVSGYGAGSGGNGGGAPGSGPGPGGQGTTNTGGGGGGGGDSPSGQTGGPGGSGIIILRHSVIRPQASTTGTVTISANAGYIIYQFTGSGSIIF